MTDQLPGAHSENIWMIALYEQEANADELLNRLRAIGVDTSEATTVRVEINDQMRRLPPAALQPDSVFSIAKRGVVTGALSLGAVGAFIGMITYGTGLFVFSLTNGIFNQSVAFLVVGTLIGALLGMIFGSAKERKTLAGNASSNGPNISAIASDGFLVAVKMAPSLAEQAEQIARGLGAKEILL